MNTTISIILAAYNGEGFIKEQIDSILRQTIQDFELIICDDCSTDSTYKIIQEYAKKDNRIRALKNEYNMGFKKNFEKLVTLCETQYIAFCDQDDIWLSNHLELLVSNIGDADLIVANAELINEKGESLNYTLRDSDKMKIMPNSTPERTLFTLLHRNYVHGSTMLIQKNLVDLAMPIPQEIKYHDQWFGIVAALNKSISYLPIPVTLYRQHGGNVTTHHKWNSFIKIKSLFTDNGNHRIYKEQLGFLLDLQKWSKFCAYKKDKELEDAVYFYKNLIDKKPWKSFPIFVRDYSKIYLSKNVIYFVIRLFCIFVLKK